MTRQITPHLLRISSAIALLAAIMQIGDTASAAEPLQVGMAAVDVTPNLDSGETIYLAGLESDRKATGIHDHLSARALVLKSGEQAIALVSVDSIGLQRPTVEAVRRQLDDLDYVLVASTHTHASPDVIGLWGPSQGQSGVSPAYLKQLEEGIVRAVREAAAAAVPARAFYGTAEDVSLLGDYRLPEVYDPVLRAIRFERLSDGRTCGVLVQWNAHGIEPRNNPLVSRDFMGNTVDELQKRHECPVIYFSGPIGGLMGTPRNRAFLGENPEPLRGVFDFIGRYGRAVADLADKALDSAEPIELAPFVVSTKPIAVPLDNAGYRTLRAAGVLTRDAFEWTGSYNELGSPLAPEVSEGDIALDTEVAYLRLGELDVAGIPGEIYPELIYGEYQDPVDPGADFPDAPLETPVMETLPGEKVLILGLANDEIGYIIPKRQWDVEPPYCYGRTSPQYGERNSVGPETARILTEALADRVREAESR